MLGAKIKQIREDKKLGLNETARMAGISGSYLSDIEKGRKQNPSTETIKALANALEVSIYKFTREDLRSITEDRLQELDMTFEELSEKTKIPMTFFDNLDDIIPDESDYDNMRIIAQALNIPQGILLAALSKQEPPVYENCYTAAKDDFDSVKEDQSKYEVKTIDKFIKPQRTNIIDVVNSIPDKITDIKQAMNLIMSQPDLMLNGEILSDDSKIALANAIQMGLAYAEQMQKSEDKNSKNKE